MLNSITKKLCGLLLLLCFYSLASFSAEMYKFDPNHTLVIWSVNHFGFSEVSGKFLAEGTLQYDENNPQNSKLDISIPVSSIVSGVPKLDKELQGKSYFNSGQFAAVKFVSTKIEKTGKDTGKVFGDLTIRGITKQAVLNVKLVKKGKHPLYNRDALGFTATTKLKRSDYGMSAYIPGVSDEVTVTIHAEAISEKKPSN